MQAMMRDRTAKTLLLTGILTLLVAVARSSTAMRRNLPDTFWAQKLLWREQFDIVVAGDSRVYRGVSPEAMERVLPGLRAANFGFSSCALTPPYLQAAESLLDPRSAQPTIILGVTASALTPAAAKDNGFLSLRKLRRFELVQLASVGQVTYFLSPFDLEEVRNLFREEKTGYVAVWHPDGWVESRKVPEDPTEAVRVYRRQAKREREKARVSEPIVAKLLDTVRAWRARGILVYGFRPPTTQAMVDVETKWMKFDEPAFAQRFIDAGGVWLSFPVGQYDSYDGSHLRDDAAVAFSTDLARLVQQIVIAQTNR
jgi:hypothetical protein